MWVLGTEPGSSVRAVSRFNGGAISPAPTDTFHTGTYLFADRHKAAGHLHEIPSFPASLPWEHLLHQHMLKLFWGCQILSWESSSYQMSPNWTQCVLKKLENYIPNWKSGFNTKRHALAQMGFARSSDPANWISFLRQRSGSVWEMDYLPIHLAPTCREEGTTETAWGGIRTTYLDSHF